MPTTAEAIDLPFDEAIAFFRQKTNVPTKGWTDVYAAAHSHSFMVAGASSQALVADFRAEIEKALEQGTTLADFRKGFDGIVAKHGWSYNGKRGWRTRTIFDTNLRTAYSAGRYAQQTLPETIEAFPFWQYNHSGAIHPRKEHLAWDGLVLSAHDTFWQTNYPPNGWHCGCFTTPVSRGGLRRQGKNGPDEAPERLFRAEEVGGKTVRVPFGVDPGFEYNPGQTWLSGGRPFEPVASADQVRSFAREALAGRLPVAATVPVAEVPPAILRDLDLDEGTRARLSVATIRQHAFRPEISAVDYAEAAAELLGSGEVFEDKPGRLAGVIERFGQPFVAGFKRTALGEMLMTTLHRSRPVRAARVRQGLKLGQRREEK